MKTIQELVSELQVTTYGGGIPYIEGGDDLLVNITPWDENAPSVKLTNVGLMISPRGTDLGSAKGLGEITGDTETCPLGLRTVNELIRYVYLVAAQQLAK